MLFNILSREIKSKRSSWQDHGRLMNNSGNAKKIIEEKVEGKREKGRPKKS